MPSEGHDNPIFIQTKIIGYAYNLGEFSCIQVDPLLCDGLDPPGNVCPHCDLTQSGDFEKILLTKMEATPTPCYRIILYEADKHLCVA